MEYRRRLRYRERRPVYWVCGVKNGRIFVLGPHDDKNEALSRMYQECSGAEIFELKEYDTRNSARATQYWKSEVSARVGDIGKGLERASHKTMYEPLPDSVDPYKVY